MDFPEVFGTNVSNQSLSTARQALERNGRIEMLVTVRDMSEISSFAKVDGVAVGISFELLRVPVLQDLADVHYDLSDR